MTLEIVKRTVEYYTLADDAPEKADPNDRIEVELSNGETVRFKFADEHSFRDVVLDTADMSAALEQEFRRMFASYIDAFGYEAVAPVAMVEFSGLKYYQGGVVTGDSLDVMRGLSLSGSASGDRLFEDATIVNITATTV